MKNKLKSILYQISSAILLAGLIIFVIGLYYLVIKAGIPYQDPTLELQIQYEIDYGIGSILSKAGIAFALCGGIARLLLWLVYRTLEQDTTV